MSEIMGHTDYDPADLVAIKAHSHLLREDAAAEFGGASLAFARQLDYVKARTYNQKFPDMKANVLVPDSTDNPPWAETISIASYDAVGMAKIISNYADDLPRVDVRAIIRVVPVKTLGDSYGYNVNEIRASRANGIGLDTRKAAAARRAIEIKLNKIKLVGDPDYDLYGLFTHPNVPQMLLPNTGDWMGLTGDEILANLLAMQDAYQTQNKGVHQANFLALAPKAHFAMLSKTLGAGVNPTSPMTYYKELFPEVDIQRIYECEGMGTGAFAGEDVALLYENNVENISHELVMPFDQLPPEARNLEFVINCLARSAGVQLWYPLSMLATHTTLAPTPLTTTEAKATETATAA